MKKLFGVLVVALWLASCQKNEPVDYVLFSGKVNGELEKIEIYKGYDLEKEIQVNENATFSDTIRIPSNDRYYVKLGSGKGFNAYFKKGARLAVTFDAENYEETLKFSGDGAAESKYLLAKREINRKYKANNPRDFFVLQPDSFKTICRALRNDIKNLIVSSKELPNEFAKFEITSNAYEYLWNIDRYEGAHRGIARKQPVLPEDFLKELDTIDFLNESLYQEIPPYETLVNFKYLRMHNNQITKDSLNAVESLKKVLSKIGDKPLIRNSFLGNGLTAMHMKKLNQPDLDDYYMLLKTCTDKDGLENIENNYDLVKINNAYSKLKTQDSLSTVHALNKLMPTIPEGFVKNRFLSRVSREFDNVKDIDGFYAILKTTTDTLAQARYAKKYKALKTLTKGSMSPIFNYENHKGGTTDLTELKGEYVYIDVWATWCVPCLKEVPALKKLEEEYKNKPIRFVSISIDEKKDYQKWKKMVTDKALGGVQLFADNAWESDFIKKYGISAIPRFILIDKQGKVLDGAAPRPSDPKLGELFKELKI